nr:MAG TPA: hypothetical protein [Caudoviricetes sp.]
MHNTTIINIIKILYAPIASSRRRSNYGNNNFINQFLQCYNHR